MTELAPTPPPPPSAARGALSVIDRLLRGGYTDADALREGRVEVPIRALVPLCVGLGAFYGASMGLYSALTPGKALGWLQVLSSAAKVPLLFLFTLCVTFPSLYVVSALARSRLSSADTLRLLLAAIAVHLALLASLGPVAAFFTLSTDSYPFMKLLHAVIFAGSGAVGLGVLLRALGAILGPVVTSSPPPTESKEDGDGGGEGAETPSPQSTASELGTHVSGLLASRERMQNDARIRTVFRFWMLIYGAVAAQMGWILRPFIGSPDLEFALFRERESNFLTAFFVTLGELFRTNT